MTSTHGSVKETREEFDAIVVGAGVSGIYQIKRLIDLGLRAIVLEADDDLGGTWYRNRYPGARFDSESYTYGYSFSQELLEEWHWKERYSSQPENLKYLNFVADKFDLRCHIRFNTRVLAMQWDEAACAWTLRLEKGSEMVTPLVICAIGPLSMPTLPNIEGMSTFKGPSFHTYHWPKAPVSLSGQRVGVVGTGATGIQVIGEIADKVGSLTVFQRRPNWSAPLNNSPISEEEMASIRARYEEIFATCRTTPGGFEHVPDRRGFWKVSREERLALWDALYDQPGFSIWLRNFTEIFTDEAANEEFSEYIAERIRQRVVDPRTAEKLIPKDHGFGVQRLPMETHYFEAFNRPNVRLVDISESPIVRVTETGIETVTEHHALDLLVYATGFDAITGGYDRIDIEGMHGGKLVDQWRDGPSTYLGTMVHGFPNLLMIAGPQSGSASTNFPRAIEAHVDWVTEFVAYVRDRGLRRIEATAESQSQWHQHVKEMYEAVLMRKAKGWMTGYNSNVEGHEEGTIRYLVYNGGAPKYNRTLAEAAAAGYPGIAQA